ncbi:transformer-2 protein homolog beta-like [Teleopsis dalmanni]|uniref:transformer-2 protein homolog beta-like n=1 Tax=Teleopsis dalmanni TaxID=139649 RepID=UPI0018CE7FD1|nr:transformer-2 protein homolog beta-like [Teleopsis dalmanni]
MSKQAESRKSKSRRDSHGTSAGRSTVDLKKRSTSLSEYRTKNSASKSYSPNTESLQKYKDHLYQKGRYGNRFNPKPNKVVGVFGLSQRTTPEIVNMIFEGFGKVKKVILIRDKKTQLSRGFGFIHYKHLSDAKYAVARCKYLCIHGRNIRVDFSISDRPHKPFPAVYRLMAKMQKNVRDHREHHEYRHRK